MKKYIKIRVMLFKNQKLLIENSNHTPLSFLKNLKQKKHIFTGHHHRSNRQSGNSNKEINQFLSCFSEEHLVTLFVNQKLQAYLSGRHVLYAAQSTYLSDYLRSTTQPPGPHQPTHGFVLFILLCGTVLRGFQLLKIFNFCDAD